MNLQTETPEHGTTMHDRLTSASTRSGIYGLLAALYRTEPGPELVRQVRDPAFLESLSALGLEFDDDLGAGTDEEVAEKLALDYTQLFLGPGGHLSPHESVHHVRDGSGWGTLWGEDTARVKGFIEAMGLTFNPERNDIPDHISVEFEVMHRLTEHEAKALESGDVETAAQAREAADRFLQEHLLAWAPEFCRQVRGRAQHSFYRELASLTEAFLEFEQESHQTSLN